MKLFETFVKNLGNANESGNIAMKTNYNIISNIINFLFNI